MNVLTNVCNLINYPLG